MSITSGTPSTDAKKTWTMLGILVSLALTTFFMNGWTSLPNFEMPALLLGLSVLVYYLQQHGASREQVDSLLRLVSLVDPRDFGSLLERVTALEDALLAGHQPSQEDDHSLRDYR